MNFKKLLPFIFIIFILFSCKSTEVEPEPVVEEPAVIEEIEEVEEIPEPVAVEPEVIEEVEEIPEVQEDDDVVFMDDINDEYLRSIGGIETDELVTQDEFEEDKAAILAIIDELSEIMQNQDALEWLKYIDKDSREYYSNPANLRKAQKKLPNKLILLKNIGDYFTYVFIPARQVSRVDEIRYISKTEVKAVEVKEDESTVVYYFFKKINNQWYVHLPVL